MDHYSHSIDIEAAVSLEDRAPSKEEIASGEIEAAASLADGDSSNKGRAKEEPLASSMWETINALPQRLNTKYGPTIFRVPYNLRKNRENLIEPSVVSIGPYHRGRRHLTPMEDKKWLLLQDILSRCRNKVTLNSCVEKIKGLQLLARNCYSERVDMDDDSFVEMLILDGTFIIQFLVKPSQWFEGEIGWASTCVHTDLILLENQIPFFVVQSLWNLYIDTPIYNYLNGLIDNLLKGLIPGNITIPHEGIHHLLHLCYLHAVPDMSTYQAVLPGCSCLKLSTCMSSKHENRSKLPCATELQNSGIKFRKKKPSSKMMEVTFQRGMLEIPFIQMVDPIKPIFINLLAFEQSKFLSLPSHLISYASFMDSIINTERDVAILQRQGIIGNQVSGEEEVALFFNQLCTGTHMYSDHYLAKLVIEVNRYCDSKCHRYRAKLMRDYFNSPWSLISFIAAIIILGLTFAQTYFAGDAYFHPHPN